MTNKVCGKIIKNLQKRPVRIGGPRYVCMDVEGHDGDCGKKSEWMGQFEHAEFLRKKRNAE